MKNKMHVSRQVRRAEERKVAKFIAKKLRSKRRKEEISEPQETGPQQRYARRKYAFENATRIMSFFGHLMNFIRTILGLFGLLS